MDRILSKLPECSQKPQTYLNKQKLGETMPKLYCLQDFRNGGSFLIEVELEQPLPTEQGPRQAITDQVAEAIRIKDGMNWERDSLTIISDEDSHGIEKLTLDALMQEAKEKYEDQNDDEEEE